MNRTWSLNYCTWKKVGEREIGQRKRGGKRRRERERGERGEGKEREKSKKQGNSHDYIEQQVDYLTLKFECLAIEDEKSEKEDKEDEKTKWETQFLQYFGFIDEKLLERMYLGFWGSWVFGFCSSTFIMLMLT